MAFKFNPFTGTLDVVNTPPASYIDGEVEFHGDLPVTATPAINSAYLVRKGSGVYFLTRKPAGIWVRELNNGNLDDWKYAGNFSDLYRDSNFRVINDADTSREIAFSAASISSGQTRTLTVPDKNITLDDATDTRDPNAHAASHLPAGTDELFDQSLNSTDAVEFGQATLQTAIVQGDLFLEGGFEFDNGIGTSSITTAATDARSLSLPDASGTLALTSDFAAPPAIGNTTPAAGSFTTLAANNGTLTASAPVLDLAQTWDNAAVAFTALRLAITNTASLSAVSGGCRFFDISIGGASQIRFERNFSTPVLYFGSQDTGLGAASSILIFYANGAFVFRVASGSSGVAIRSDAPYAWSSSTNLNAAQDLFLRRDDAGTLAQYNGTNAQTFNIYNTFTSATNHERGFLKWSSNVFQIGTEKGSGGGTARALEFRTDNVARLTLGESGGVTLNSGNLVLTDNTGSETATFDAQAKLTANRTYDLPDADGTLVVATGAVTVEATSDTLLTFNLKGSDNVVRSVAFAIS
jgi:hypothetical protein